MKDLRRKLSYVLYFALVFMAFETVRWATRFPQKKLKKEDVYQSLTRDLMIGKEEEEEAGDSKLVILLANQRTGSTFLGQFFNQDPDIFYMFEPVDSVYSTMFGTEQGYNVPTDIFFYKNGTRRIISDAENKFVGDAVLGLLHCDFKNVPIQMITNKFLDLEHFYFSSSAAKLSPFIKCLIRKALDPRQQTCQRILRAACPRRFGANEKDQAECFQILLGYRNTSDIFGPGKMEHFTDFSECMENYRERVFSSCIPEASKVCLKAPMRVVKTVRLSMQTAKYILEQEPKVKTLHLIRDPRSVASSRSGDPSSMTGLYSGSDIIKEATLYCQQVVEDISIRAEMNELVPKSVLEVLYEDLATFPMRFLHKMYGFLGYDEESISREAKSWVMKNTKEKPNKRFVKWKTKLNSTQSSTIMRKCSKLLNMIPNWLNS